MCCHKAALLSRSASFTSAARHRSGALFIARGAKSSLYGVIALNGLVTLGGHRRFEDHSRSLAGKYRILKFGAANQLDSHHLHHKVALVGRSPVFEQIKALPRSERHVTIDDRNR